MKVALHWQILIALLCGVVFSLIGKHLGWQSFIENEVAAIGDIFLRLLRMVIVPLIMASIVTGMTSIGNGANLGRIGLKTFLYYMTTTLLAIVTGLFFANFIKPGVGVDLKLQSLPSELANNTTKFGDTLWGIIPTNPIEALASGQMLPIIFFSLILGFFITRLQDKHKNILSSGFDALFEVMMSITNFVIKFTPLGVFALIAETVSKTGLAVFENLGAYVLTVITALSFHALITLPTLLYFIGRINPISYAKAMSTAFITAFSTASSLSTLPVTLRCIEKQVGVSNKISSFVLPLGATINMDGTALYQCIAPLFIAQVYGIDLDISQQIIVVVTALLASVGAAGIPMAGLVMMTIILESVGLPLEGIGLVLAVDRILDMIRTTVNVWSDSSGAAIIAKTEKELLSVDLNKNS